MRILRLATAFAVSALASGCVTAGTDTIRFQSSSPQQFVALRDGESVITSRGRSTTVTLKSAQRQVGSRPSFVVGIDNNSDRPVEFLVERVVAQQRVGNEDKQLKVYSYAELVQEEQAAQVGRTVLVALVGGVNAGLAGRSGYRQAVAEDQNAQLAASVAAKGEQNLQNLEQMTIKNQTIMPGETYAGLMYIEGPVNDTGATKDYSLVFRLGGDRHEIHVIQNSPAS
jgi:hypothetical protein